MVVDHLCLRNSSSPFLPPNATMASSSTYLGNFLSFLPSQLHLTPTKPQPTSLHIPHTHEHDRFPSLTSKNPTFSTVQLTPPSSSFRSLLLPQTSLKDYTEMGFEVMETAFPALAFANVHWSKSGCYNVQIVVGENESEDELLRRFRKEVSKAGIIREYNRRLFYEDKRAEKKRRAKDIAMRNRKRRPWQKKFVPDDNEGSKGKKTEAEDNWEFPVGEIPYYIIAENLHKAKLISADVGMMLRSVRNKRRFCPLMILD